MAPSQPGDLADSDDEADTSSAGIPDVLFRSGSGSQTNRTPRLGKDDDGLSFTSNIDRLETGPCWAVELSAVLARTHLTILPDPTDPDHWLMVPLEGYTLAEWAATRDNAATEPHPLTLELGAILRTLPRKT